LTLLKTDRLLGIVTYLLNHGRTKAKDLAEQFEVSIRTIHRDLEAIDMAGIPIVTFQGGDGGVGLAEGFQLKKNMLTIDELDHILIGLKSVESISLNQRQVSALLEKLASQNESLLTLNNRFLIDLTTFHRTSLPQKISMIRDALKNGTVISFRYYSEKGQSQSQLEPYFVLFRWSSWYVFGFCEIRQDFRLFRLTRIVDLQKTDQSFEPREIPENKLQLDPHFQEMRHVTLLVDASLEYQLIDLTGADSYEKQSDGRLVIHYPYQNLEYVLQLILGFGDKAKVLAPEFMIEEVKRRLQSIMNRYL
jgi:predicted DNA-binding transcriptional regulator YafY